jgi:Hsp70 protein
MSDEPRLSMLALPYAPAVGISSGTPELTPSPGPTRASNPCEPPGGSTIEAAVTTPAPPAATSVGARLAVDIGADTTTALLEIDRRRIPLIFDGHLELPTPRLDLLGKLVDVKTALRPAADADRHSAEQAVYRALLQRVAVAARTPISQLVLTVPPAWGPRRRDLVRQCATDAGLPPPIIVSEAAAAAQATLPHAAGGASVLVCDLGTRGHLTVLARTDRGWHQLATRDSDVYGGQGLDRAMAQAIAPEHADDPALLARCASARLDLHAQAALDDPGPTAIRVPGQDLATIYHFDDLIEVADLACQQVVIDARETLAAAGTPPGTLSAVVVRGGASRTIDPAGELRAAVTATPVEPDDPHLLCRGALTLATPPSPAPVRPASGRWLRPGHLAAIAVPAILGAFLASQEINETYTYTSIWESYRDIYDYEKINALFDRPAFALAAWCLSLSAIAAGTLFAAVLHRHDVQENTPGGHARQGGRILSFAAIAGAAIALTQAMLAYTIINGPSQVLPNFAGIVAAGIAAPTLVTLAVSLLAPLSARLRAGGWADRLHHPAIGVITAACGGIAGNLYFDHPGPLALIPGQWSHRLGVALLAIAIAVTLFTHRAARTVLAVILAFGGLLATSNIEIGYIVQREFTTAYLVVVALWWVRRALRIGLDALPDGWPRQALTSMTAPTPATATADAAPPTGQTSSRG